MRSPGYDSGGLIEWRKHSFGFWWECQMTAAGAPMYSDSDICNRRHTHACVTIISWELPTSPMRTTFQKQWPDDLRSNTSTPPEIPSSPNISNLGIRSLIIDLRRYPHTYPNHSICEPVLLWLYSPFHNITTFFSLQNTLRLSPMPWDIL